LDAWVDWDQNGSWDPGEQVMASELLHEGENVLTIDVPETALPGETYARFRFSTAGGLSPDGAAGDGEVEDHMLHVDQGDDALPPPPPDPWDPDKYISFPDPVGSWPKPSGGIAVGDFSKMNGGGAPPSGARCLDHNRLTDAAIEQWWNQPTLDHTVDAPVGFTGNDVDLPDGMPGVDPDEATNAVDLDGDDRLRTTYRFRNAGDDDRAGVYADVDGSGTSLRKSTPGAATYL
jgi:hypothetical protein